MKVYVAGPMRGIAEFNFPAFLQAQAELEGQGHNVFNPAMRDIATGFEWQGLTGHEDLNDGTHQFSLREALGADTAYIAADADAVCVLPGWSASRGARAEVALAAALGLQTGYLEQFEADSLQPATEFWDQFFAESVLLDEAGA